MKKLLFIFGLFFCVGIIANAQTTTVSATVVDSDNVTWANGTWKVSFTPNPSQPNPSIYNINGTALSPSVIQQNGLLDGSGNLSFTVYKNASISPVGSTWTLTVCPDAITACGSYNFSTASNSTMDISTPVSTAVPAPRFKPVSGSYGYIDGEATISLLQGSTYWNVTNSLQRCYTGSAWVNCGGGGGGGTVAVSPPAYSIQIANSPGASNLTSDPNILIDPVGHTLNVGVLPASYVTIGALGTPTAWNFDTTTPTTARQSIGAGTGTVDSSSANLLAYYQFNGAEVTGTAVIPDGIQATTQAASDNTDKIATTRFVAAPGAIGPTSVALAGGTALTANHGTGSYVQHSDGTGATGHLATYTADGSLTDGGTPSVTTQILATVSGTCTLVDDSSGGAGCISAAISWGVTMPATYNAWCAVNALNGSVLWQNHTSVAILGTPPLSGSSVTWALDNNQSAGRGATAHVTCWATN